MRKTIRIYLIIISATFSCAEEEQPRLEFTLGDQAFFADETKCHPSSPVYYVSAWKGVLGSGSYHLCRIEFYGNKEGYAPLEGNYLLPQSPNVWLFGHAKVVIGSQLGHYESESGSVNVKYRFNRMVITFTDAVMRNADDNTLNYASGIFEFNCK
jgi:hypothetical protein